MIESGDLAEFRINFQKSTTLGGNSLKEYFNIAFTDHADGTVDLDVWRGGVGPQHLDMTDSGFVDLGIYLSGLVEWRGLPAHHFLSAEPTTDVGRSRALDTFYASEGEGRCSRGWVVVPQWRRVRRGQQGSAAAKELLHRKSRTLGVCPVQTLGRNLLTVVRIKPPPPKDVALAYSSQPSPTPERIVDAVEDTESVDGSETANVSDSINDNRITKDAEPLDDPMSVENPQVINHSEQEPLQKVSLATTPEPVQDLHSVCGANITHHTETIYGPLPPDPSELSDGSEYTNNVDKSLDFEVSSRF